MKVLLALFFTLSFLFSYAQENKQIDTLPKNWKMKAIFGLNGTQTSFVNWSAGGRNNVSVLGSIIARAEYDKNKIRWLNDFSLALGGLKYIEKNSTEGLQ